MERERKREREERERGGERERKIKGSFYYGAHSSQRHFTPFTVLMITGVAPSTSSSALAR